MAATTSDKLYRGILSRLQAQMPSADYAVDANYIYLSPFPIFVGLEETQIQIIPGVPIAQEPRSGGGLVEEEFQVATWHRVLLDRFPHSTTRLSDSSFGLLYIVGGVRQALIQDEITVAAVDQATINVQWLRGSQATENEEHKGWAMVTDTFRFSWEITWTTPAA